MKNEKKKLVILKSGLDDTPLFLQVDMLREKIPFVLKKSLLVLQKMM